MPGPEKKFEEKVKKFLKDNNCWYVKFFANRMTKSGVPDLLACVNGHFLGIELKAENGKPTELQLYNRREIRNSGGLAIVLYPDQFEHFKELINALLRNDLYDVYYFMRAFDRE